MMNRPILNKNLDKEIFCNYYYLKKELVDFCMQNNLPSAGNKIELTERIAYFLDTGKIKSIPKSQKRTSNIDIIAENTIIEENFVCSEKHRAFFKEKIGKSFSFNVSFQKWLKNNSGKMYNEAIIAYHQILKEKKKRKTTIDKQFEYNAYIRDFFADNKGKSLKDAIKCWKYKKRLPGHNRYEKDDLNALS